MSPRAICVSQDAGVRGTVGDALAAAGLTVEHHTAFPTEPNAEGLALVVIDRATRQAMGDALRTITAPVVVVGDHLDDDALVALMLEAPVSHLVEDPRDRDLGITSQKLVSGDLFGLEKYVAAGVEIHERTVVSHADKRLAMSEVCSWAEQVGARRPVVLRIESVVDELVMNALHDAPSSGEPTRAAVLRWASDDRVLALSVTDTFGAIRQRDVIDNVRRARREGGRPQTDRDEAGEPRGAGLGLYLVVANVAALIVNVDPGRRTEIVCLFDLARVEHRAVTGAVRSLHVFSAA